MLATNMMRLDGSHEIHYIRFNDPDFKPLEIKGPVDDYFVHNNHVTQYYFRITPAMLPNL